MIRHISMTAAFVLGTATAMAQPVPEVGQTGLQNRPLVIAHRGASGYLPEHTTEAAAYAHAMGVDFIEQDIVLSRDGVPMVLHDVTLDDVTNVAEAFPGRRRTDGHWYVFDFDSAELQTLRVVERDAGLRSVRFPRGQGHFQIAALSEQIELIQGLDTSRNTTTGLYIELKQPTRHREEGLDSAAAVLAVLGEYKLQAAEQRVYLQCFEAEELKRLRTELNCRLPLIQLLKEVPTAEQIREHARVVDGLGVSINCVITGVTEGSDPQPVISDVVRDAHAHALQVHVWTIRSDRLPEFSESTGQLLNWLVRQAGVDGVFADQPDVVLTWWADLPADAELGPFRLLKGRTRPARRP